MSRMCCIGLAAHQRWCPRAVGRTASQFGEWAERAEALADEVGSDDLAASNVLYSAAARLLGRALVAQSVLRLDDAGRLDPGRDSGQAPASVLGAPEGQPAGSGEVR